MTKIAFGAKQKNIVLRIFDLALLAIYFGLVLRLFYMQATYPIPLGKYLADLQDHLQTAVYAKGYSLMSWMFKGLYMIWPDYKGSALMLALIATATVPIAAVLMKRLRVLIEGSDGGRTFWHYIPVSIFLTAIVGIYVPVIHPYIYRKNQVLSQPWHNSTYLLMRMLSLAVLIFYFKIREYYFDHVHFGDALCFMVLLTLANFAKPSFVIAFGPVMLLVLIYDFCRSKAKKTIQIVEFGVCVLLSLWPLLIQSTMLFAGEDAESSVVITLDVLKADLAGHALLPSLICNMIFPILVVIFVLAKRQGHPVLLQAWLLFIVSWLEGEFISETGLKANDGNFGWGVKFFAYFLVMVSMLAWNRLYHAGKIKKPLWIIGWIIVGMQLFLGLAYFGWVWIGEDYYI